MTICERFPKKNNCTDQKCFVNCLQDIHIACACECNQGRRLAEDPVLPRFLLEITLRFCLLLLFAFFMPSSASSSPKLPIRRLERGKELLLMKWEFFRFLVLEANALLSSAAGASCGMK